MRAGLIARIGLGWTALAVLLGADVPSRSEPEVGPVSAPYEMLHPDASWCGPRVLYFFSVYLGRDRSLEEIVALCKTNESGLTSLADLLRAAELLGLSPTPVSCTVDDLADFDGPALVSLSNRETGPVHFVGVLGIEQGNFVVLDPSAGVRTQQVHRERIARSFTGHAILLGDDGAARTRWINSPGMIVLAACWMAIVVAYARPEWTTRLVRRMRGMSSDARQDC